MDTVYAILNLGGELFASTHRGPVIFTDLPAAMAAVDDESGPMPFRHCAVQEIQCSPQNCSSFTDYNMRYIDGVKLPDGAVYLHDFTFTAPDSNWNPNAALQKSEPPKEVLPDGKGDSQALDDLADLT